METVNLFWERVPKIQNTSYHLLVRVRVGHFENVHRRRLLRRRRELLLLRTRHARQSSEVAT
jgi:hypothetical protein